MKYPALFTEGPNGGYTVTFRDIPEAISEGPTIRQAQEMALDALCTAMEFYFEDGRAVPAPSKIGTGETFVSLPASIAVKVALLNARLASGARPADIARTMGSKAQEMTRVFDLGHSTKIDTVVEAMAAMGYELDFRVRRLISALFAGGPLEGQSLVIANEETYTALDLSTGKEVEYRRHTASLPVGVEMQNAIYVPAALSRTQAMEAIRRVLPKRGEQ